MLLNVGGQGKLALTLTKTGRQVSNRKAWFLMGDVVELPLHVFLAACGKKLPGESDNAGLLKYQAVAAREVDCLDVYTTDGRLLVYDLTLLEDDRGFFPPYQAAPLVRGDTLRAHPEIAAVLSLLADALDEGAMRELNLRVQEQGEPIERVAQDALENLGLVASKAVNAVSKSLRAQTDPLN